jgi:hypothetical protein
MTENVKVIRNRPATYLFRAGAAHVRAHITHEAPERAAKELFGDDAVTDIVLRAATTPAAISGTSGWASSLAGVAIYDLVQTAASLSAAADVITRGRRVDLTGIAHLTVPGRVVSAAGAGQWVKEGEPDPVRAQVVTQGAVLEPRKLGVISVFTAEIAESANVEDFTRAVVSESAALALDAAMFSTNSDDGAHPAGLLYGVTPLTATSGGGLGAMQGDLKALAGALAGAGGGMNPVLVAAVAQATSLKLLAGPRFDVPILPSTALASGTVVLIEASSLVSGFDSVPEFETSRVSLLHMEDATPAEFPAAPMKSMWQADSFALKMILRGSWAMRAPHVAYITGATW